MNFGKLAVLQPNAFVLQIGCAFEEVACDHHGTLASATDDDAHTAMSVTWSRDHYHVFGQLERIANRIKKLSTSIKSKEDAATARVQQQ